MSRFLHAAFALLLLAAAAQADTLRVPQDFETIQAAVIAAEAGDTVLIKSGSYDEFVLIDGKTELVVRGSGKVEIAPGGGSTALIVMNSSLVQIVNLRFPSPVAPAFFSSESSDITLSRCRFEPEGATVALTDAGPADTPQAGGVGFQDVDDVEIDRCRFKGTAANGVGLGGGGHPVHGASVQHCRFEQTGLNGVDIGEATGVLIAHNVFLDLDHDGVRVGALSTVESMTIEHNSFRDMEIGIEVAQGLGPMLIQHNTLRDFGLAGIVVAVDEVEVRTNKLSDVGSSGLAAIDVTGTGTVIAGNKLRDVAGSAVALTGGNAVVSSNKVRDAGDDGFHNNGNSNSYDHNSSLHAGGDGFELIGTGLELTFDKATGSGDFDLYDHSPGQNTIAANCHFGTEHP